MAKKGSLVQKCLVAPCMVIQNRNTRIVPRVFSHAQVLEVTTLPE